MSVTTIVTLIDYTIIVGNNLWGVISVGVYLWGGQSTGGI